MKRLLFLMACMPCLLFTSCSSSDSEDDGSGNTTDIAVTSAAEEVGFSYAVINGYANLNLLASTTSNYDMGIEYAEDEAFDNYHREKTDKLVGTKITVTLENLTPETKYYYRTFVRANGIYNYGQTKSFTTKSMPVVAKTGDVTDVSVVSASVTCQVNTSGIAAKDMYNVGVAYATNKQDLQEDGNHARQGTWLGGEDDWATSTDNPVHLEGNTLHVQLSGLQPSTTYYYCAYTKAGEAIKLGDIKTFTTESVASALTVEASDITMHSATITGTTKFSNPTHYVQYSYNNSTLDENMGWIEYAYMEKNGEKLSCVLSYLQQETTYYYRVVVQSDYGVIASPVKSFTTKGIATSGAVDLGLSCQWAACNLGASRPEETGDYYAWGETSPRTYFAWENYQHLDTNQQYIDIGSDISGTQYDAARSQLGAPWRMPTRDEARELVERCSWEWTYYKDTPGYTVTGPNGNAIFIRYAGWYEYSYNSDLLYWTSQQASEWSAYYLSTQYIGETGRYCGLPIRPVRD